LFRRNVDGVEVMLVHPGGPFWTNKDKGAWSIPKGEFDETEDPLDAARRELHEETGIKANGKFIALQPVRLRSGKWVLAWALEKDVDVSKIRSNHFSTEWPPGSGRTKTFPEVDRAGWFAVTEANEKINPAQAGWLRELERILETPA